MSKLIVAAYTKNNQYFGCETEDVLEDIVALDRECAAEYDYTAIGDLTYKPATKAQVERMKKECPNWRPALYEKDGLFYSDD